MKQNSEATAMLKKSVRKIKRGFANIFKKNNSKQFFSKEEELAYYYSVYQSSDLYGLLEEFSVNNHNKKKNHKAIKILKISKFIYEQNAEKQLRLKLAELAFSLDKSPTVLKGVAWSGIHAANYVLAVRAILELVSCGEEHFTDLEKLKSSLASRLFIQDIDQYLIEQKNKVELNEEFLNREISLSEQCFLYYKKGNDEELISYIYAIYHRNEDLEIIEKLLVKLWVEYDTPTIEYQKILINLGKKFSEENKKEIDCLWVEKAISIEKNTMTMKAAFWCYQRAGDIAKSKESLVWLENYAEEKNDAKLKDFVNKRKHSYLFLTSQHIYDLLTQAENTSINSYHPNDKTIAYILHNSLPYASGGYATRGHGLAVALKQQGYIVEVINRPGFPLDTKSDLKESDILTPDIIEGVKYSRIPCPRRDKLATYEYLVQASEALYQSFLDVRPEMVIAASNHLTAIPAMIAARKLKIPFYYEVRGFWEVTRISREPEFEATEWYKLLCEFEALTAKEADHVFTLTTPMLEELVKRGVNKEKITLLPNSCNPENFIPRDRDLSLAQKLNIPNHVPVIGYIGTFVQYEGLDHLAEACGLLKQKGIEFRLLIVGNENTAGTDRGPITQSILGVAQKYELNDWLIMPGRIPHDEVESYYSLIDIAPFPRKPQPVTEMVSPMKPLEAAAMKKAIIASSVKALVDMIDDGRTGMIFEKGNIEDFAAKLELLLQDKELRVKLGDNARAWVENERTWKITTNRLIKIIS